MRIECLASSSSGNCYFVEFGNTASILIEAGIPINEIKRKLFNIGKNLSNIDCVLVTHNHQDHVLAAKQLASKEFLRVWGNYTIASKATLLEPLKTKWINSKVQVIPFEVEHDAEMSLGFVINAGAETLLFVNDCKFFKADVYSIPFDYIMIECNYSAKIVHTLNTQALKDNNHAMLKRYERLLNSHMSDRNCLKILKRMNLTNCKGIFLMHLSDRHSNEYEFKNEFKKELNVPVYICKKNGGIL